MSKDRGKGWLGRPQSEVVVMVVLGAVVVLIVAGIAEWLLAGKGILGQAKGDEAARGDD